MEENDDIKELLRKDLKAMLKEELKEMLKQKVPESTDGSALAGQTPPLPPIESAKDYAERILAGKVKK